jgi:hypothetical protein
VTVLPDQRSAVETAGTNPSDSAEAGAARPHNRARWPGGIGVRESARELERLWAVSAISYGSDLCLSLKI